MHFLNDKFNWKSVFHPLHLIFFSFCFTIWTKKNVKWKIMLTWQKKKGNRGECFNAAFHKNLWHTTRISTVTGRLPSPPLELKAVVTDRLGSAFKVNQTHSNFAKKGAVDLKVVHPLHHQGAPAHKRGHCKESAGAWLSRQQLVNESESFAPFFFSACPTWSLDCPSGGSSSPAFSVF